MCFRREELIMSKENEKKKTTSDGSTKTSSKAKKSNTQKKVDDKKNTNKKSKATTKKEVIKKEAKVSDSKMTEEVLTFDDDLEVEEEILEEVVSAKKDNSKNQKNDKQNIEKIEKKVKEKNKRVKTNSQKESSIMELYAKYGNMFWGFVAGVLVACLIAFLIWPDRIAALKNGEEPIVKVGGKTYTADSLYENMKSYYSVSLLLDQIDDDILTAMYPEDDKMTEEVKSNAEYYLNTYKQYYNYTEEEFLEKNGFSSYDAFLDYLRLDYRRNKYMEDYVTENLSDEEIQKYYDDNVFGDINTQHILVEVKSDSDSDSDDDDDDKLSDEDAKKLAEEIITKLNDGTKWDKIKEEYKDKVTFEDLGYQSWDASLEDTFMDALKKMDDDSFSEEPVKTSYGYHVIYRLDQKEKPSLKDSKDKIIENLIADKKSEDSNLLYKALINLRDKKEIDFSDTDMKSKYEAYCKQYK